MTTIIERRNTIGTVELRADGPKGKRAGGYALRFNALSQNLGGFVERVQPSFVDRTLNDGLDVLARFHHDSQQLLGRTAAETVRLTKDGTGLDYDVDVPDTSYGRDLIVQLGRGDIRGSSFAFQLGPDGDSWGYTESGFPLRDLVNGIVVDVAPVVTPAYPDATAGLRSLAEHRSLDLDVVRAAAEHNQLGELMRSGGPRVVDAGGAPAALQARLRAARLEAARAAMDNEAR